MRIPTLLDAVVLAPAAMLGLLGLWLGFTRSLVAWPMRWLIPLLGAGVAALPATLYLAVNGRLSDLLRLSGTAVVAVAGGVSFLVTLMLLAMFMANLKGRVAAWAGGRRSGVMERVLGAFVGIACGVLVVGVAVACTPMWRETAAQPAWVRESVLLPYLRRAADGVGSVLLPYLPTRNGPPPRKERTGSDRAAFAPAAGSQGR